MITSPIQFIGDETPEELNRKLNELVRFVSDIGGLTTSSTQGPKGDTGAQGDPGPQGPAGSAGAPGQNSATLYAYKRQATEPTDDPGTVTYTFATPDSWTPGNGWSREVPAGSDIVWVVAAAAVSDTASDQVDAAEWSDPVQLGANGVDGLSTAIVYLYQRTATNVAPATPTTNQANYVFSTGVLDPVDNGWTQGLPSAGGDYLWLTFATAISNTGTDDIASGEWATAELLSQNGAQGPSGVNGLNQATLTAFIRSAVEPVTDPGTVTYTFADASWTPQNGWSVTVPAGSDPLYAVQGNAVSDQATDVINTGEWSDPVIIAQDGNVGAQGDAGAPGLNSAVVYLYQRTNDRDTAPFVPSTPTATYTFATGDLTTVNNGWSSVLPPISDGRYLWITFAVASGTGATDDIDNTQWATPEIFSEVVDNGGLALNDGRKALRLDQWFKDYFQVDVLDVADGWSVIDDVEATYNKAIQNISNNSSLLQVLSEQVPVTANQRYRVQCFIKQSAGDRTAYLGMSFYDSNGDLINNTSSPVSDAQGWSIGTNHYTELVNQVPPAVRTKYEFSFGGSSSLTVPSNAVTMALTLRVSGTGSAQTTVQFDDFGLFEFPEDGTDGRNQAQVFAYKRSASAPTDDPGTVVYTFETSSFSPQNGWSAAVPAGSDPLYVVVANASSRNDTDTIDSAEWSSPVILAQDGAAGATGATGSDGAPGLKTAVIYLYQRTASDTPPPDLPSISSTYTFSTSTLTAVNNGWTRDLPPNSAGRYLWVTFANAAVASPADTDVIVSGEWSDAEIFASDGENGNDGIPGENGLTVVPLPVIQITTDNAGVPKAGAFDDAEAQFSIIDGATDVTESTTFSIVSSANLTLSVSNTAGSRGLIQVSGISADSAFADIDGTYNGRTARNRLVVKKVKDGENASADIDDQFSGGINSSYPVTGQGGPVQVAVGSTGTIRVSGLGVYEGPGTTGTIQCEAKIQYRVVGSPTWIDFPGTEVTGGLAFYSTEAGGQWDGGLFSIPEQSIAIPSTNEIYEAQCVIRRVNGSLTSGIVNTQPNVCILRLAWSSA